MSQTVADLRNGKVGEHDRKADRRARPLQVVRLWLAVRYWAVRVPLTVATTPELQRLLERTRPDPGTPFRGLSIATIAHTVRRAVRHPQLMANQPCLREGLLFQRFLVMAGYAPTLHFGIDRASLGGPAVTAHCWVTVNGAVYNAPQREMVEVFAHQATALVGPASR